MFLLLDNSEQMRFKCRAVFLFFNIFPLGCESVIRIHSALSNNGLLSANWFHGELSTSQNKQNVYRVYQTRNCIETLSHTPIQNRLSRYRVLSLPTIFIVQLLFIIIIITLLVFLFLISVAIK